MDEHEVAAMLRRLGHRVTPQRLLVLTAVMANRHHLTADAIHAAVIERQPYIDIATVYRTLQLLQADGLVVTMSTGDGKQRYQYRHEGETHHHLVCRQCGAEIQIPDDDLAALKAAMAAQHGFTIDVAHLALLGMCATCRATA